jgi:hypothetical protein
MAEKKACEPVAEFLDLIRLHGADWTLNSQYSTPDDQPGCSGFALNYLLSPI